HRQVARAGVEHGAPQVVDFHFRRRGHRVLDHDLAHLDLAERAAALGERREQFMERQHARHASLFEDHQRAEVLLRHGLHRVHRAAAWLRGDQPVSLDPQDFFYLHLPPPVLARVLRHTSPKRGSISSMTRLLLALALCFPFVIYSQPYPTKPIRIIVTYPAGGGADAMARLIAPKLGEALGQPVLVENRGGASGTIAAELVAKSAPDGATLMLDATAFAVNQSLYPKLPYDPEKSFAPITLLALFPNIVVVHPSYPVSSVRELIAKIKAEPGRIAFASSGNGSAQHLAAELFRQRAGLDMVHVPYKGGG